MVPPTLDSIFAVVPASLAAPLTVVAGLVAAAGAGLVLTATIYGTWTPALWAAATFGVAGLLWQAADRAVRR